MPHAFFCIFLVLPDFVGMVLAVGLLVVRMLFKPKGGQIPLILEAIWVPDIPVSIVLTSTNDLTGWLGTVPLFILLTDIRIKLYPTRPAGPAALTLHHYHPL